MQIGQGTYSSVYRARDLESNKIVALKKVRFANMDPESVRFMAREILIQRRLDHPNVMKLESLITSRSSGSLYLVFEYMEHDLAGLAARPEIKFTEAQVPTFTVLYCWCDHATNVLVVTVFSMVEDFNLQILNWLLFFLVSPVGTGPLDEQVIWLNSICNSYNLSSSKVGLRR